MMRKQRGFSVMEIVISLAVTLVVLVSLLTVFSSSNKVAVASRNRSVAILLAQGLMDDIETHTYGHPRPQAWPATPEETAPVRVFVGNREQAMIFQKSVTFENGSFVGEGTGQHDLATITITWSEGIGNNQTDQALTSAIKELEVRVPVWRKTK